MKRVVLVAIFAAAACSQGALDEGLARAVDRGGPKVAFDLAASPLPNIPFPNDVAATRDGSSPTGFRLNSSIAAPSQLETRQRALLDTLDGFGTFAPITVAFDRDIDVASLVALQNDADAANDGIFLVNLASGGTAPVDICGGRFPITLSNPSQYFANDPSSGVFNLLFPVSNVLGPLPVTTVRQQADNLLGCYELSTHTLIIRPAVPLLQDTRYAVVLTNRIHDAAGNAISSPHAGINHSSQTHELAPLASRLPAGVALSDVAYTWAFTTQSTSRTLELLREGLSQGNGPFANALSFLYRVSGSTTSAAVATATLVLQARGVEVPSPNQADYILPVNDCAAAPAPPACFRALLDDPQVGNLFSGTTDPAALQALEASLAYVDYFVTAVYSSPDLLTTDFGDARDAIFQVDEISTTVRNQPVTLPFLVAVPKEVPAAGHLAPFPAVIAGHDFGGSRNQEVVSFGGTFAKFGLATVAIDAYGQGISVDPALEVLARAVMAEDGVGPFANVFFRTRARDLDFDGANDPGGDFWTFDSFHTRDAIRQTVLDEMQLIRLLRTFDGTSRMPLGNQPIAIAGDYNNNGIPDLAGGHTFPNIVFAADGITHLFEKGAVNPGADLFSFGVSLGGVTSSILPAVEPEVFAGAEVSAAGGLMDVALRSTSSSIVNGVLLEALGPFFATCPFSASSGPIDPQTTLHKGGCNPGAADAVPTLVMVVQEVNHERDLPIRPLSLLPGDRLMVQNLSQGPADCSSGPAAGCFIATADASGNVRVPFAADPPQLAATETSNPPGFLATVSVTELSPGDSLSITLLQSRPGQAAPITTFGLPFNFSGISYRAGDTLTAVARGYGLTRNTPAFRRMMELSQVILEPADPVNYVNHYAAANVLAARATPDTNSGFIGGPASLLAITTSGDTQIPASTGLALARSAGLIEMSTPDPAYGLTDDQVLIRGGVVEGIASTDRFDDVDGGVFAALPGKVQCDAAAAQPCSGDVLLDSTGYACTGAACTDGLGAPRLVPPLRQQLTRAVLPPAACPFSARASGPGCWSTGASACAANVSGLSALMIPYSSRTGAHGISGPQPGKPFDVDQFIANAAGRYFECRGREVRFDACQAALAGCPWIPPPPSP